MIKKVCVVGGGNAGLMPALILKTRFPNLDIDLIKSDKIGIIGVGEGSTEHFKEFMDFCGITGEEIIKETGATYKVGVYFKNWLKHDYVHCVLNVITSATFGQYRAGYAYATINNLKPKKYTPPTIFDSSIISDDVPFQFHFNTFKLNEFLLKKCRDRGINVIDDEILDLKVSKNKITSLIGKNKKHKNYDFYIDSTGFKKVLISKLGAKWKSYKKFLPLNEAIAFQTKDTKEYPVVTQAIKMKYGWMWRIPTQGRWGNGYVFNNKYIDKDKAKKEVEKYLKQKITIAKNIQFEAGALEKSWIGNCLATGLAASFIEPLEASSIGTTIQQSFLLIHMIANYSEKDVDFYNKKFTELVENIRDFVALHYYYDKNVVLPDSLKNNIKKWKNRLPIYEDFENSYLLFKDPNFIILLKEYGLFNKKNIKYEYNLLPNHLKQSVLKSYKNFNDFYKTSIRQSHKKYLENIVNENYSR